MEKEKDDIIKEAQRTVVSEIRNGILEGKQNYFYNSCYERNAEKIAILFFIHSIMDKYGLNYNN